MDAITLLTDDHRKVKKMFQDFARLTRSEGHHGKKKADLVQEICTELKIHTQVEEEVFYPAVRAAIRDDDLMDDADLEHARAKDLIGELEAMDAGHDQYDAKVTVLGEQVDHHVKEEHDSMFPKARNSQVDLAALGREIAQRKEVLRAL